MDAVGGEEGSGEGGAAGSDTRSSEGIEGLECPRVGGQIVAEEMGVRDAGQAALEVAVGGVMESVDGRGAGGRVEE